MFSARFRHREEVNVEIDMVPIMNMFLVLIPFLLISSSFLHLKAINTSVPVKSTSESQLLPEQSDIALTLMVNLNDLAIEVSPTSPQLNEAQLSALDFSVQRNHTDTDFSELTSRLVVLKNKYPNSETMILSPADSVPYQDMVKVMDAARGIDMTNQLFSKVVISGILK